MKIGDLVKWTHPDEPDVGIVVGTHEDPSLRGDVEECFNLYWAEDQVHIEWSDKPEHSGIYPIDHKLLELIDEDR